MSTSFQPSDIQAARALPEEEHPAAVYLAHLGPGSLRTMVEALEKLARMASAGECDARSLPWHTLRIEHTSALRSQLASDLAPATANKHLAALRGVLRQAWRLGLMTAEDYQRTIDLPTVHGPAPRTSRALSLDELRALVDACQRDDTPSGTRDAALLALLFGAGLRRAEVVALDLEDFDRETGTLTVVAASNRRARRFTANQEGRTALEAWIVRRSPSPGPLFNPINKAGRIEIRRLSEQAIYVACRKRSAEAGLDPVSPEDLRRSLFARRPQKSRPAAGAGAVTAQTA